MRALQVTQHGSPSEALALRDMPEPEPGPGQLAIRVAASTLDFNDIDRCRGRLVTVPPPFTLGMDCCGVVEPAALEAHERRETAGRAVVRVGGR